MNNISTGVSENWNNINNNHNPSLVPFVGLQPNNYKQFLDWETNSYIPNNGNNNNNPFNITNSTTIFDYTHLSSLPSPSFNANLNFIPPQQFSEYPSVDFLKKEVGGGGGGDGDGGDGFAVDDGSYYTGSSGRIGLNLGHRTYFSSRETALIDRLFRRPRGFYQANQVPRCQAEGCKIDLTNAKHYHRRHKVCEFHSKATKVVTGGIEQRFCQQCSRGALDRFHVLAEFDQVKRSCRKRLADHNRRRRKPQLGQSTTDSLPAAQTTETANPQVGPSASISRSEHKETSLSSSATTSAPSRSAKSSSSGTHFINGPDLSLGGEHQHQHQRPFFYNQQSSSDLFSRANTAAAAAAPYHNLFFSTSKSNEGQSLFESDVNYV